MKLSTHFTSQSFVRSLRKAGSLIASVLALAFASSAEAQVTTGNFYWSGNNGVSSNWNQITGAGGSNWSSSPTSVVSINGSPNSLTAANVYFYESATNLTNTVSVATSINSLNFLSGTTGVVTINSSGSGVLTIGAGGITEQSGAAANILNTGIDLGAAQTWTNNSTNALTINGVISDTTGNALTLAGAPGNAGFVFTNANTYTGATSLSTVGASLTLSGNGSILNTSSITLAGGTTLGLNNTITALSNRLASTVGITSNGGTFNLIGNATTATSQTVGTLTLGAGQSFVNVTTAGGGATPTTLTFGSASLPSFSRSFAITNAVGAVNGSTTTVTITASGVLAGQRVFIAGLAPSGYDGTFTVASATTTSFTYTVGSALGAVTTSTGTGTSPGGSLNFATTGTIVAANVALDAGALIGGWATIGNINSNASGNVLNFATITGGVASTPNQSGTIVATTNYTTLASGYTSSNSTNALVNASVTATSSTVNSLYLTGAAQLGSGTAYNLVIANGGIIANGVTAANSLTFSNFGAVSTFAGVGSAALSGAVIGTIAPAPGVPDLVITTASNLQINAVIGNTGTNVAFALVKNGSGFLDLSNNNGTNAAETYTGGTVVNGGTIVLRTDSGLGAAPGSFDATNVILNGGAIFTTAGFGLNANRGFYVGTSGGTWRYVGGGNFTWTQAISGPGSFTIADLQPCTTFFGANTSHPNTYLGSTTLQVGTNSLGNGIFLTSNNVFPTSTALNVSITGTGTTPNVISFGSSATAPVYETVGSLAGSAPIINFNAVTGQTTLTLGSNNLNTTFSGSLSGTVTAGASGATWVVGTVGTGSVTKVGTGIETFSGINNYSGATQISGGTLLIGSGTTTTSTAILKGLSAVTVASGGTLGGNGTINGTVTVQTGGALAPAMSSSTFNTLTIASNLTIASGAILNFNLGTAGSPGGGDLVQTTGTGTISLTGTDTLNLNELSGFGVGTYNLLTVAGTGALTNNAAFSVVGSSLYNYAVAASGSSLVLTVTPGTPTLFWTGGASNVWQVGGPINWTVPPATTFATGNNAIFDDTATQNLSVSVAAGGVSVNTLTVQSFVNVYSFSGGPITVTGSTGLTKSNGPAVTFNNNVTTPATTVLGGTLTIASSSTFTSTLTTTQTGATLSVNGALITGNLSINSGGSLTGIGSINGNATVGNPSVLIAGAVSPGASPTTTGTLTLGSSGFHATTTLSGAYDFLITTLGSTASTAGGSSATAVQDLLAVTGSLNVSGATININATGTGFAGGNAVYSWTIATATGGVSGTPVLGTVSGDFAPFASPFSITTNANSVFLTYSNFIWLGTTNGNWSAGTNWATGVAPGTGLIAKFTGPGNGNTTISLGGTVGINTFLFDTANAAAYTFGAAVGNGDTFRIDSGGSIFVSNLVTTAQTFNTAIQALGALTITNNGSAALTFNGNLTLGSGGTAGPLTFTGTGPITYAGNIAAGSISSLVYNGPGSLTLGGNNGFSSGVILNSGLLLNVNSATALGTGALTITGGAIDNTSGSAVTVTSASGVKVNGPFSYNASNSLNFGATPLTLNTDLAVTLSSPNATASGALTFGSSINAPTRNVTLISGSGSTGTGSLNLTGASINLNNVTVTTLGSMTIGQVGGSTNIAGTLYIDGGTVNQPLANLSPFALQPNGQPYGGVTGGTITLLGNVTIANLGMSSSGTTTTSSQLNIGNNSSLTVNAGANGTVNIGFPFNSNTSPVASIIEGGTNSSLVINAGTINIGAGGAAGNGVARANVLIQLGSGNNILTAANAQTATTIGANGVLPTGGINIGFSNNGGQDGDTPRGDPLGVPIVIFGTGSNAMYSPNLTIAGAKTPGYVFLASPLPTQVNTPTNPANNTVVNNVLPAALTLAPATTYAPSLTGTIVNGLLVYPTLTLQATASGGKMNVIVGNQSVASGTNSIGVLDTSGGIVNATLGTVSLGLVTVGVPSSTSGGSIGSWVLGTGNNVVTLDSLNLANTFTGTAQGITAGIISINGGTITFNSGTGTGIFNNANAFSDAVINLNAGTLNMNNLPVGGGSFSLDHVNMTGGVLQNASSVNTNTYVNETASVTSGQQQVTGLASTSNLFVGMGVSGVGIPPNTTILSIDSPTQVTLSNSPTATGAVTPLAFSTPGFMQTGGAILVDTTSQAGTTMTSTIQGRFAIGGGAIVQLNAGTSGSGVVTLTTPTLLRGTKGGYSPDTTVGGGALATGTLAGTLDIIPVQGVLDAASGGSQELFNISGGIGSLSAGNSLNPNLLQPWIIARTSGAANASANFAQFDTTSNGIQALPTASYVTYASGSGINSATANDVGLVTTAQSLSSAVTVFALKVQSTISDSGTNTLNIAGNGTMGGLILNGGSIAANGGLQFAGGTGEGIIYTTPQGGTISAPITAGALTTFGPGTLNLTNTTAGNTVGGAVNVNGGKLFIGTSSTLTAGGAVNVNAGAALAGLGTVSSGFNNVTFGPAGVFAPGNAGSFGVLTITTTSGSVITTTQATNPISDQTGPLNGQPTNLGLGFGLGISPTNIVGSNLNIWVGKPAATGAPNSGLSNGNILGNLASGFNIVSTGSGATVALTTATGGATGQITGVISAATLVAGGSGYSPNATFNLPVTESGGALGIVNVSTNASGQVTTVNSVVNGGYGYQTVTTTTATGTFYLDPITTVTLTDPNGALDFLAGGSFSYLIGTVPTGSTGGIATLGSFTTVGTSFTPSSASISISGTSVYLNMTVLASNVIWTGASSGLWNVGSNWNLGVVPGSGNEVFFNSAGNGNTTIDLGGAVRPIGSITVNTASAAAYTFGKFVGDAIAFDAGGAFTVTSTVTTPQTINAGIQVVGTMTISNSGSGGLTINGNLTLASGGTASLLTFGGSNPASVTTYNGIINSVTGLTQSSSGAGTLILSNANTYTGPTTISSGSLIVSNTSGSATGTGPVTVSTSLSGTGFIVPNTGSVGGNTVNVFGSITPGSAVTPGTLTIGSAASNATVTVGGTQNYLVTALGNPSTVLGGSTSSATQSLLVINGSLNMTSPTVNVSSTATFAGNNNYSWELATTTRGITAATLPTLVLGGTFASASFTPYFVLSIDANNMYLTFTAPAFWTGAAGSGGSGSWGTAANWNNNVVPVSGQVGLFAATTTNNTVNLNGVVPINTIKFDTAAASAYTLGAAVGNGDAFLFDAGGGVLVTSSVTTPQIINANLQTLGPLNINNSGTGGLTLNGNLVLGSGGTAGLLGFGGTNAASVTTYAGNISTGVTGITINESGAVTLSGNNTFTGGITVNNGTLNINSVNALGSGPLNLKGGAINNNIGAIVYPSVVNFSGNFGFGGTQNFSFATVTQTTDVTVSTNAANNMTFGTYVTNSHSFTLAGAGTGNVTFNGLTFNNLSVAGTGTITLTGTTTVNGAITLTGGAVTQQTVTSGTLTVGPFYQVTVAGALQINGNTTANGLSIGSSNPSGSGQMLLANGVSLTVNSAATDVNIGYNIASTAQVGALLTASGNASVTIKALDIVMGGGQGATAQRSNTIVTLGSGNNSLITTGTTGIALGGGNNVNGGGADGQAYVSTTTPTTQNSYGAAVLFLGAGSNTLQASQILVGGYKTPGYLFLTAGQPSQDPTSATQFTTYTPSVYVAGASVTISGANGGKTALIVGNQNSGAAATASATTSNAALDTTGGVLKGTFGTVTLGYDNGIPNSAAGGAIGSWVLGVANNAVTLDSLNLADVTGAPFNQGIVAGIFSVNGGNVSFNNTTGTGILYGNTKAPLNAPAGTNATINLNGGTLNLNGLPIGSAANPIDNFNMLGGTLVNATNLYIGNGTTASNFTQTGGQIAVDTTSQLGKTTTTNIQSQYTIAGGSIVQLNAGTAGTGVVTLTTPTLQRSTSGSYLPDTSSGVGAMTSGSLAGTLDIIPTQGRFDAASGSQELFNISGGIGSVAAGNSSNGNLLQPWIIVRTSGAANASANFTQLDANNNVQALPTGSYVTYASGSGLNSSTSNDVGLVTTAQTVTASPTVFALKVQNTISGSGTLAINGNSGGNGLILDGGTLSAGGLQFGSGTGEALIYTTAQNGTISSPITAGALTTFGPGKLTLSNTTTGNNISGVVNVNSGTLFVGSGSTLTAGGAVNINNGASLVGLGTINSGSNNVTFGPSATFAPGNGAAFGVFNITTSNGNVVTTTQQTNPAAFQSGPLQTPTSFPTSGGLGFGLGISPTNVVGSNFKLWVGTPAANGAVDTGLSNNNVLGSLANGFSMSSSGSGLFTLDPITTVTVIDTNGLQDFYKGGSFSYLVGTVPTGSSGAVTNLGNFALTGLTVTAASLQVSGTSVYLNFTTAALPTFTWIGGTSNAWTTGSNWTGGATPVSGNTATFNNSGSGNTTISLGGAVQPIGGITFDTAAAAAYTVGSTAGDALKFDANGTVTVTSTVTTAQAINAAIQTQGALTVANNGTGGLTFRGGLTLGGGSAGLLTISGTGTTTYSGNISTGVNGITYSGSGLLTLSGTNSFIGTTTILSGTANINSDGALGSAANGVALTGGTLQFAAGGGVILNSSRGIVLGGGAFDTNSANDTINGVVSGTNLVKNGGGDLTVTNTSTYTGSTTVNAGGLVVGSTGSLGSGPLLVNNTNPAPSSTDVYLYNTSGQTIGNLSSNLSGAANGNTVGVFLGAGVALTVNQTAPTTFQGTIFGGGNLVLGSSSTSTLTLSGNSIYTGSTTINGGTLQLGVANALPATTPLTLGSGGTLNLNNNNQTIAALNSSAGNINTGTGTGGILTIGNTAGGTVTYSGVISGTGGLTWGIVNTNVPNPTPSTLLLTSASTNTGPMTINTGTLSIGTAYALSGGVAPVLPYSVSATYPGAFTLGPTATLLTNGLNVTVGSLGGGGPIGGNINLGNNSSSTLYIVQSSSTGYAGIISGTGNVYIVNGVNLAVYGNWTLTGGVTHDVTNLQGNHTDSPKSYLPFAIAGNSAVTTQGINFAGFTDQVSTIFGGSSADNNAAGTFVDTGSGGKLVLSYYAASVSAGGPSNGLGGNQTFSGFFMNDVGLIFDAGYWGTAQQMTLSGPNNTTGPLTIGFTNQTTPQFGAATGAQSGVANQVIVSATSTFGAVTVGNSVASNLVNNLTVMAGTGNLTAASVTIGESAAGSTGNNSVTVGGTLTAGAINVGNTNGVGVNLLTIQSTGIVNVAGAPSRSAIPFRAARARTR